MRGELYNWAVDDPKFFPWNWRDGMKIMTTKFAAVGGAVVLGALLASSGANAGIITEDFAFYDSSHHVVASGSFAYDSSHAGNLSYADLSAFTITIDNPPGNSDQNTYDLNFVDTAANSYIYFDFNTVTQSFVPGAVSGFYCGGCGLGELIGAISASGYGPGFYLDPMPGSFAGNNDDGIGATYPFGGNNGSYIYYTTFNVAVPEPLTLALFGGGLLGLGALRWRKKKT